MKVIRFDKSKFSEWNEFVTHAKNGVFLLTDLTWFTMKTGLQIIP